MAGLDGPGRLLVAIGLVLLLLGGILLLAGRIPALRLLGRLPGDIVLRWSNGTFFFPLATCLLLSLVLTVLLNLIASLVR